MTGETHQISVGRAGATHVTAVVEILNEATRYKAAHGDLAWGSSGGFDARDVSDAMVQGEVYVVRLGEEIVGTVRLQWSDEHYWGLQPPVAGYIHGLAVKDGFHGRGIGATVLNWAIDQISLTGLQFLRLDCGADNAGLCRYYEDRGFIQVGQRMLGDGYAAALYQREATRASKSKPIHVTGSG